MYNKNFWASHIFKSKSLRLYVLVILNRVFILRTLAFVLFANLARSINTYKNKTGIVRFCTMPVMFSFVLPYPTQDKPNARTKVLTCSFFR